MDILRLDDNARHAPKFLRAENYFVGDIRRFITFGSPFQGSPWANTVEQWVSPFAMDGYREAASQFDKELPPALESLSPAEGILTTATNGSGFRLTYGPSCYFDLRTDSPICGLLNGATYPMSVVWLPAVSTAIQPGDAILSEYGTDLADGLLRLFVPSGTGPSQADFRGTLARMVAEGWLARGDAIVSESSQMNVRTEPGDIWQAQMPNDSRYNDPLRRQLRVIRTAHSPLPGFPVGQGGSEPLRVQVGRILYQQRSKFLPGPTLGDQP